MYIRIAILNPRSMYTWLLLRVSIILSTETPMVIYYIIIYYRYYYYAPARVVKILFVIEKSLLSSVSLLHVNNIFYTVGIPVTVFKSFSIFIIITARCNTAANQYVLLPSLYYLLLFNLP